MRKLFNDWVARVLSFVDGAQPLGANKATTDNQVLAWDSGTATWIPQSLGGAGGLSDPGSNGLLARTALGTTVARTLTAPAAGLTISNPDGVSGNPTFALANDLAALEALGNGFPERTGVDTWASRTDVVRGNLGGSDNRLARADGAGGVTIQGSTVSSEDQIDSTWVHNDTINVWTAPAVDDRSYILHAKYWVNRSSDDVHAFGEFRAILRRTGGSLSVATGSTNAQGGALTLTLNRSASGDTFRIQLAGTGGDSGRFMFDDIRVCHLARDIFA